MKRPVAILLGFAALATGAVALAEAEEALLKRSEEHTSELQSLL